MKKICMCCKNEFESKYSENSKRGKFCGLSCSVSYNNSKRKLSEETKNKLRESTREYWRNNKNHFTEIGIIGSTNKFRGRGINSILDVSKRTVSKILKRLNLGCCVCGWNEASCDIHHINGRKVENCNGHWNLTILCPNHHRMFHCKKISKEDVKSLDNYIPSDWRNLYYG